MGRKKQGKKNEASAYGFAEKKVAIVCDWLTNVGGAEKVLYYIWRLFPEAPIYTSQYDSKGIDWFSDADVRVSKFLQKFPAGLRRFLGPFRQWYFSRLDLSEYDLIISVTGAEAKSVKSGKWLARKGKKSANPKGVHVCYCHVPTQYYWQMYDDYIKNPGFGVLNPSVRFFFRLLVIPLRRADLKAAQRPDYYITISEYAKELIRKYYGRESTVIHPPVELDTFRSRENISRAASLAPVATGLARSSSPCQAPDSLETFLSTPYYIVTSRQVNWKRIDLAVKACLMTQRRLLVIGEGPEHKKLVKLAKGSGLVRFLPLMDKKELAKYIAGAKGYLFPSLEPFGIAPVEALAVGCPVIAFSEGGSKDYIKEGKNGLFFEKQTAKSLAEAILKFEKCKFNREKISKTAASFSVERFEKEVKDFIKKKALKNEKNK